MRARPSFAWKCRSARVSRRLPTHPSPHPHQPNPPERRTDGNDDYWVSRYARRSTSAADDETDEWLLSWDHLRPLLAPAVPVAASVLDLGCGTSTLALDMLRDHLITGGSVTAVDLAPAAIDAQRAEQQRRTRRGQPSASRCTLVCADAAAPGALTGCSFDAVLDKSTTDGLLCDTRNGASRVRRMYEAVGRTLRPSAVVAVVSWRDPQSDEGVAWLVDLVWGGLRQAQEATTATAGPGASERWRWSLDVHSPVLADGSSGPHVYLLRRRVLRASPRQRRRHVSTGGGEGAGEGGGEDDGREVEEELSMKLHVHESQ